jgi:hypothetical protein
MKLVVPSSGSMIQTKSLLLLPRSRPLLGQDAVGGIGLQHGVDDGFFGQLVDLGDEVVGALGVDLQQIQVHRSPVDDRSGGTGGLHGDVEHGVEGLLGHGSTCEGEGGVRPGFPGWGRGHANLQG